jgi:DNA-binding transcriptional regulator YiaG
MLYIDSLAESIKNNPRYHSTLHEDEAMLTPEEIKALREHTEMTHVQMAQLFRVRPADVMAWENGILEPDEDQMEKLERLLASGAKKMRFKFN